MKQRVRLKSAVIISCNLIEPVMLRMQIHCISTLQIFPGELTPVAPLTGEGMLIEFSMLSELGRMLLKSVVGQIVLSGTDSGGLCLCTVRRHNGKLVIKAV